MNEKRIEQVMQIEKQAQQLLDSAKQEAAHLPVQAERDAQKIVERTRAEAQAAAQKIIARAAAQDETAKIQADADKKIRDSEDVAKKNLGRAVEYVLDTVLGKA
jgi:vacuolar-type H+-ATPase subunit H